MKMLKKEWLLSHINEMEWKAVVGYEGIYEVSNYGVVKRLPLTKVQANGKIRSWPIHFFIGIVAPNGYFRTGLRKNGIRKYHSIHRLVATAFKLNPHNKPQVNHKDGNKKNNFAENLEWVTQSENMQHALKTGLFNRKIIENSRKRTYKGDVEGVKYEKGSRSHFSKRAKLTWDQVDEIRSIYNKGGVTYKDLAGRFNVSSSAIGKLIKKHCYKDEYRLMATG